MKNFLYLFCLIILSYCHKVTPQKEEKSKLLGNLPSIIIDGSSLTRRNVSFDCIEFKNKKIQDNFNFLNTNIVYYGINTINKNKLNDFQYYKLFLVEIPFLNFLPNDFIEGNFKFNKYFKKVENYGDCHVGEFIFLNKINSRQNKAYVLFNTSRNEVTIWYYDNMKFDQSNIVLTYSIKGINSYYIVKYSKECEAFIPLE
ncbi:hypothetical protein LF887_05255 [Chryseobacterium sp. MEBOG06]|uniref:hypothetical protein n=1 Tax=Chryseobacterium sp. MEBOG06 TaxID=2879938 RepID=UPI001F288316|nr:hypothetical protein [Chryseobacterium sp. MEBOG06]UKB85034.1 hypothetical protein LF887_05255 [Chryseobacterium sp. MEBOG06]